jgi:hypothetical protein
MKQEIITYVILYFVGLAALYVMTVTIGLGLAQGWFAVARRKKNQKVEVNK